MTMDSASVAGEPARVVVEETLARIELPRPLAPGDSTTFRVHFRVGVPRVFDRFGHMGNKYSIAQWYPKMVVYEKRGWARDPYHTFAEFYGEFATYDVAVTIPDEYWVGSTGVLREVAGGDNLIPLQDPSRDSVNVQVLVHMEDSLAGAWPRHALRLVPLQGEGTSIRVPRDSAAVWRVPVDAPVHYRYAWADSAVGGEERQELDPAGRPGPVRLLVVARDTTITDTLRTLSALPPPRSKDKNAPADSTVSSLKTLHIHAERVHDFAFVAATDYVRADTTVLGTALRTLTYRDDVPEWRRSLEYVVRALHHHTDLVGPYIWPMFTSAESFTAGGAMEYPMLIMNDPDLIAGEYDGLDATIAHEFGHNWFYGMVGTDERRHPWLDEGFTQYLEDHYMTAYYPRGSWKYRNKVPWAAPAHWYQNDEASLLQRHDARDEMPMSFAADDCRAYAPYAVMAYSRPEEMLRTFEGIVGPDTMRAFMHEVYKRGVLRHLEPEDVVAAATAATGRDQSEYFRQWTETVDVANFSLAGTHTQKTDGGYTTRVTVKRSGGMTYGVPVEARFADGTTETRVVPTPGPRNETVFTSRSPLRDVTLDPRHQVFDAYRLDNQGSLLPPMRIRPLLDVNTTDAISVLYGPTVWHGRAEGARLGAWVDGRYLRSGDYPSGIRSFEGGWSVGTRDGSTAWRAGYARRMGAIGARGSLRLLAGRDAGLTRGELSLSNWITEAGRRHPWRTWSLDAQWLDRDERSLQGGDDRERVDPAFWSPGRTLNVGASLRVETLAPRRRGTFSLAGWKGFDPEGGDNTASYERVSAETHHSIDLGQRGPLHLDARAYAGAAWRRIPNERLFDIAQATRLETLDRFYANDRGPLRESDHYWTGGGGGLRGYADRAVLGRRIGALSLDFHHAKYPLWLFADAARVKADAPFDKIAADAGVGFRYLYFRIDAPFWISTPEPGEKPYDARWVVSFDLPDFRWH